MNAIRQFIEVKDQSFNVILPEDFSGRGECFKYSEETYERVF